MPSKSPLGLKKSTKVAAAARDTEHYSDVSTPIGGEIFPKEAVTEQLSRASPPSNIPAPKVISLGQDQTRQGVRNSNSTLSCPGDSNNQIRDALTNLKQLLVDFESLNESIIRSNPVLATKFYKLLRATQYSREPSIKAVPVIQRKNIKFHPKPPKPRRDPKTSPGACFNCGGPHHEYLCPWMCKRCESTCCIDSTTSSVHIPSKCAKRNWSYIMGPYVTEKPLFRTFQPKNKQVTDGISTNSEPSKVEKKTRHQGGREVKNSTPAKAVVGAEKRKNKAVKTPTTSDSPPRKRGPPAVPVSPPLPLKSNRVSAIHSTFVDNVKQHITAEKSLPDCSLVSRVSDSSSIPTEANEQLVNVVSIKVVEDCKGNDLKEVCFATSNSLSESRCTSSDAVDLLSPSKELDTECALYTACNEAELKIPHHSVSDNENECEEKQEYTSDIDASMKTLYKHVIKARTLKYLLKSQLPNATSSEDEHEMQALLKEARRQYMVLRLEYNERVIRYREQMSLVAEESAITQ